MLVARLGYWENSFWNLGQLCGVLVHGFCVGVFGNIRGLELLLNGSSERTPSGSAAPKTANMTTSVFFENRPD